MCITSDHLVSVTFLLVPDHMAVGDVELGGKGNNDKILYPKSSFFGQHVVYNNNTMP